MKNRILIGISGKMGSGKNTVAAQMYSLFNQKGIPSNVFSIAAPLKQIARDIFDVPEDLIYGDQQTKEALISFSGGMTVREILQTLGRSFRKGFGENFLIEKCLRRVQARSTKWAACIITDVRYVNEAQAIRNEGGWLIQLTRKDPSLLFQDYISETDLDDFRWEGSRIRVLDNAEMDLEEQMRALKPLVQEILNE